ncbi:MAG: hypothetical protein EAX95_03460 [Candidatus Thorarchaeota archaeon]|nr:hypothetical protein [Candidatus Thorarchaeota archaeon]
MAQWATGQLTRKELAELRRLRVVKEALDEFKKRGIDTDIVVCPVCKSHRVVDLTSYHDLGFLGSFQPAYYCLDCGWYGRIAPIMTNRPENDAVLEDMKEAFPSYRDEALGNYDDAPPEEL